MLQPEPIPEPLPPATAGQPSPAPIACSTPALVPLPSTLPMDDEEFRAIAQEFVDLAGEQVRQLQQAVEARDVLAIRSVLHWLKGAGGTGGYMDVTDAAVAAQQHVHAEQLDALPGDVKAIALLLTRARLAFHPTDPNPTR